MSRLALQRRTDLATGPPARRRRLLLLGATVVLPVAIVGGLLVLLAVVRNRAESAVADIATLLPFGWAFAAGMVSSVNPCGFFMLPAYLSYQLGTEEEGFYTLSPLRRSARAVRLGAVATVGFIVVMGAIGGLIAAGGQPLIRSFPYAGVGIGVVLAALGLWLLIARRSLGIAAAKHVVVTPARNLRNVFGFGVAYAVGSLSCTLPVFLLVVGSALASRGLLASFGQFISYALGMGVVLVAVTIGAALFRGAVARALRRVLPYVDRMSALFLIGAGTYLVYYWVVVSGFL